MMTTRWSKLLLAMLMIAAFAFVGCSDDDDDGGTGPQPVDEFATVAPVTDAYLSTYAPSDGGAGLGMNASAANFAAAYLGGGTPNTADFFLVDWRSSAAYANAHIEGATNYSLSTIIDHVNAGDFPEDKTIVNVCYSGQTASTATAILNLLGYDAVNLVYGMSGWTSDTSYVGADYMSKTSNDYDAWFETTVHAKPDEGDYPDPATGLSDPMEIIKARAAAYVKGELNDFGSSWNIVSVGGTGGIYDAIENGEWFIVNYFPDANYNAGHIPGAVQYAPKTSLLTSSTLNTLPTDGTPIGVYCWTGQTSAQVTVCLNILGYPAYSIGYGVQALCYENASVNDHKYSVPTTDYPVVGTGVTE
jgi:rhodanese-related sulfurtransferase